MTRNSIALLALFVPAVALAADRHVGSGQTYSTIQAAVDASSTNDVIIVHAGTYAERVVIDTPSITRLTIKAYSGDSVTIDTPDQYVNAIIANTTDLWINGIDILGPNHTSPPERGISFISETGPGVQTFDLVLCDVTLTGNGITGGWAVHGTPGTGPDILNLDGTLTIRQYDQGVYGMSYPRGWPVPECPNWW